MSVQRNERMNIRLSWIRLQIARGGKEAGLLCPADLSVRKICIVPAKVNTVESFKWGTWCICSLHLIDLGCWISGTEFRHCSKTHRWAFSHSLLARVSYLSFLLTLKSSKGWWREGAWYQFMKAGGFLLRFGYALLRWQSLLNATENWTQAPPVFFFFWGGGINQKSCNSAALKPLNQFIW